MISTSVIIPFEFHHVTAQLHTTFQQIPLTIQQKQQHTGRLCVMCPGMTLGLAVAKGHQSWRLSSCLSKKSNDMGWKITCSSSKQLGTINASPLAPAGTAL